MKKTMSKDLIDEYVSRGLLTVGAGSWTAYEAFKAMSDFCRDALPITGMISFIIYLILNRRKIKEALKNWKK